jgi:two-component system, OmpR family, response regulator
MRSTSQPDAPYRSLPVVPDELRLEPGLGTSVRVHPFSFDPTAPVDVRLVRWPMESEYRDELHSVDAPRILILEAGSAPPAPWDELEDWVRVPVDPDELELRALTVVRRADRRARPWLDDDNLLWFRDRWCAVARAQLPLVRLLVDHFGTVVRDEDVDAAVGDANASNHLEAIRTSVRRAVRALAPLGLHVQRVRASGFLLERLP